MATFLQQQVRYSLCVRCTHGTKYEVNDFHGIRMPVRAIPQSQATHMGPASAASVACYFPSATSMRTHLLQYSHVHGCRNWRAVPGAYTREKSLSRPLLVVLHHTVPGKCFRRSGYIEVGRTFLRRFRKTSLFCRACVRVAYCTAVAGKGTTVGYRSPPGAVVLRRKGFWRDP